MEFNFAYSAPSAVEDRADRTRMAFSPDVKREPTFFSGELGKSIEFREAISALHAVVVSDLRFKPKDKTAYKEWAAQREQIDWQAVAAQRSEVAARIKALQDELNELNRRRSARWKAFYESQGRFFRYLYEKERDIWFVLDPVITVHPDEVFFECFSQDESSYGRLGASYEVFKNVGEFACGTTNIDYSAALYDEFQKIRSYKTTRFEVDPAGFNVQTTGEASYTEVKIDLPDSWVRGFLQVSSAMALPATTFDLHPMDVHNLCFVLRRHREKQGPRSMRYHLKPGEPVRVVFEPWEIEVVCPRSVYQGMAADTIRVWGRRRILILERLIPVAKKFTVHLLGTGLPSFYVADLGDMSFTLGLSGWTANDWARAGNFDLMAPRADVDDFTKQGVFNYLKARWVERPDRVASDLNLDRSIVLGALSAYTQAGRAIYDLNKQVYRVRELSREPLPMERLRFANPREEWATQFLVQNAVQVDSARIDAFGMLTLAGSVRDKGKTFTPSLTIDQDERLLRADCTCNWHQQNKLYQGPCEHILAVRMQHNRRAVGRHA
ncbi:MAG TPA: SWIM zinc finger family protein [Blastocatellia bacterium]|nr:SWIM zinc finger family protein [Blastocatellia bacterium]